MNRSKQNNNLKSYLKGIKSGVPIGLGYFAVSMSLGIFAKRINLSYIFGGLSSLVLNASAGQYVLYTSIGAMVSIFEIAFLTLITNSRYLLMSFALGQNFKTTTKRIHKLFVGYMLTDEIFGVSLNEGASYTPYFSYGAFTVACPCWAAGTLVGMYIGSILPTIYVNALTVSLYAMFMSFVLPKSKQDKRVALFVMLAFALGFLFTIVPILSTISEAFRVVLISVFLSIMAALFFPLKNELGVKDE